MRFLRGRSGTDAETADAADGGSAGADEAVEVSGDASSPRSAGKGRPTPSRRDAERRRRGPAPPPPRTQREAIKRMRGSRDERRKAASVRRERMLSGDERYLLPRDRGKVRAYVRDIVDSRFNVAELFMPLALIILLTLFVPNPAVTQYVSLVTTAMLAVIIIEGLLLGRMVNRRVAQRFPDEQVRRVSLGFYAITRATQLRRLRAPKPRVKRGDAVD